MKNASIYQVRLWEDRIEYDGDGALKHHPLNSRYYFTPGKDIGSFGHLTFAGHNLDKSPLLDDVRVYYLEFFSTSLDESNREAWADPLRVDVLRRLAASDRIWYLSIIGDVPDSSSPTGHKPIEQEIREVLCKTEKPECVQVKSEKGYGQGLGFYNRLFFTAPDLLIDHVVTRYWPNAYPGYPIEGYLLTPGSINLFRKWNDQPKDDVLFKEMIDRVLVSFYTFPTEHRHFVFITNKLNLREMKEMIDLDSLRMKAHQIRKSMPS